MKRNWIRYGLIVFTMLLCICFTAISAAEEIPAQATDLAMDVETTATITANQLTWFRFVPAQTALYSFCSSSDQDTYGYLYEKEGDNEITQIDSDDDGGEGSNFQIKRILTQDVEYYFAVRFYNSEQAGSFPVMIEEYTGLIVNRIGDYDTYTADIGTGVELAVEASSQKGTVTYQWMSVDRNGLWTEIAGETSATFIATTTAGQSRYACYVSDGVTKDEVDFYIIGDEHLTASADGDSMFCIELNGSAEMKVQASSVSGNHSFEWYRCWTDDRGIYHEEIVEGADSATCIAQNITGECNFRCNVRTADLNQQTAVDFSILISAPVTATPVGNSERTVALGGTTVLEVEATSAVTPVSYQWYYYDETIGAYNLIEGATTSSYQVADIRKETSYFCRVRNGYESADANFFVRIEGDYSAHAYEGINYFSIDPGDPLSATVEATNDNNSEDEFSYQWYGPVTDRRDPAQPVSGKTESTLSIEECYEGGWYFCKVINLAGIEKNVWFQVEITSDLEIYDDGSSVSGNANGTTTISVSADASAGIRGYQWYILDSVLSGFEYARKIEGATNSSYEITNPQKNHITYYCAVSDVYGNVATATREVFFYGDVSIQETGETSQTALPGGSATFTVSATGDGELFYEWKARTFANGTWGEYKIIPGAAEASYTVSNAQSNMELICIVSSQFYSSASCNFELIIDNQLTVSARESSIYVRPNESATLEVTGSCSSGPITYQWYRSINDAYNHTANAEISGATGTIFQTGPINAQEQYYCKASDQYGNSTECQFDIFIDNHLAAAVYGKTTTVDDLSVLPGESITLKVSVTGGSGEIHYSWHREYQTDSGNWITEDISDVTGDTLTVESVDRYMNYWCTVTDDYDDRQTVFFYISITYGQTGPFTYSAAIPDDGNGNKTIVRGDFIPVTYMASEHATRYWIGIEQYNEAAGAWIMVNDPAYLYIRAAELPQAGEIAGKSIVETSLLTPGVYRMYAAADADGYVRTETERTEFTVVQPETAEGIFIRVVDINGNDLNGAAIQTGSGQAFVSVYAPGAISTEVHVDHNVQYAGGFGGPGEFISGGLSYPYAGTKHVVALVKYADGSWVLSDPFTITVEAEYGELQIPIPELPETLTAGTDLTVIATMPEIGLDSMNLSIFAEDATGRRDIAPVSDYEKNETSIGQTVRWEDLEEAGIGSGWTLVVCVFGEKAGYSVADLEMRIPIAEETTEGFRLTVSGESDSVTIPVNSPYSVRVTAPAEATAICVYDHNRTKHYQAGNIFEADGWSCDEAKNVTLTAYYTTETLPDNWEDPNSNFQLSYLDYSKHQSNEVAVTFAETVVTLTVTDAAGNDLNGGTIQTGDEIHFTATATPGSGYISVYFYYGENNQHLEENGAEVFSGEKTPYWSTGTKQIIAAGHYVLVAKDEDGNPQYYDDGSPAMTIHTVYSDPVTIQVEAEHGDIALPVPELPETLIYGENLTIDVAMPENGPEWMNIAVYPETSYGYESSTPLLEKEIREGSIHSTLTAETIGTWYTGPGCSLVVRGKGGKPGYNVNEWVRRIPFVEVTTASFTVTDAEGNDLEGETIQTGEKFFANMQVPGAVYIGLGVRKNGEVDEWKVLHNYGAAQTFWWSIYESGNYTVRPLANSHIPMDPEFENGWYVPEEFEDGISLTVEADSGPIEAAFILPENIQAGTEVPISWTANTGDDPAPDELELALSEKQEDGSLKWIWSFNTTIGTGSVTIPATVPPQSEWGGQRFGMPEGETVFTNGRDYVLRADFRKNGWDETCPSITFTASDPNAPAVTLEQYYGLDDAGTQPVNAYAMFRLDTEAEIDEAELYDGISWQSMYKNTMMNCWMADARYLTAGTYPVCARVRFAGDTEWTYTNAITVTAVMKGEAGPFTFQAILPENGTVTRGEYIPVTYMASAHATNYRMIVERYDDSDDVWEQLNDPFAGLYIEEDELPQEGEIAGREMMETAGLEPGEYRMFAVADAPGYLRAETEYTAFTVAEPEAQ